MLVQPSNVGDGIEMKRTVMKLAVGGLATSLVVCVWQDHCVDCVPLVCWSVDWLQFDCAVIVNANYVMFRLWIDNASCILIVFLMCVIVLRVERLKSLRMLLGRMPCVYVCVCVCV